MSRPEYQAWTHATPVLGPRQLMSEQANPWAYVGWLRRKGPVVNVSSSPRCWDLSSGHKKWIIQVPILASVVVSRSQGQCEHE